ncbi:hypothetical protein HYPSUDRAFT_203353 [Hypholoma sublateritium FD-334 SS-4]|uniref:Uncharacterized protein n=1 Tax=Hypholoma sublateritium (strain FD-334 SS-4) TaxID=945553 RepID=A0A0D2L2K7_HYPSF|nr:hypothetical protein HYPSUDRAFT_203353 [Hypholoma sublateritium FD-334 SS-4]
MPLFRTSSEYPLVDIPVRRAGMATSSVAVPPPNPDSTPTRLQNGTDDAATDGSTTPRRRSVIDSAVLTTLSPLIDVVIEQSLQEAVAQAQSDIAGLKAEMEKLQMEMAKLKM